MSCPHPIILGDVVVIQDANQLPLRALPLNDGFLREIFALGIFEDLQDVEDACLEAL